MQLSTLSWLPRILMSHLYCYTYQEWLCSCRSDVEYGQFLSNVIIPTPMCLPKEICSRPVVYAVKALSAGLCAEVQRTQEYIKALEGLETAKQWEGLAVDWPRVLSRAVAVAIWAEDYRVEDDFIGNLPVSIIRTSTEEGLSPLITFDPIAEDLRKRFVFEGKGEISAVETTEETGINFLMDLEQRKIAASSFDQIPHRDARTTILRTHGVSFLASHTLASGFITGKHIDADGNPTGRFAKSGYAAPEVAAAMKKFVAGCTAHGLPPVEVASRWVAYHPALGDGDSIVLGASKLAQIGDTVANIRKGPLPVPVVALADELWGAVEPIRGLIV
ncbi:Aflatoxin B1 aldehyde reductase member 2 [Cytospora mali]|uniref:Aflatoxin B1 aldehyde reductase member 2 n=1 Tax=Cytospora mali TaxID=578113 RepID=A0A194UNY3_CYTMA|nr:Aflatoxin B1 aldehyde reductase member 2 [Valsa mali var. pyri (nom. inval.)]